jgi:hypothetical protein
MLKIAIALKCPRAEGDLPIFVFGAVQSCTVGFRIFDQQIRYTLAADASSIIRSVQLSKPLLALFAACSVTKPRAPTLKVRRIIAEWMLDAAAKTTSGEGRANSRLVWKQPEKLWGNFPGEPEFLHPIAPKLCEKGLRKWLKGMVARDGVEPLLWFGQVLAIAQLIDFAALQPVRFVRVVHLVFVWQYKSNTK